MTRSVLLALSLSLAALTVPVVASAEVVVVESTVDGLRPGMRFPDNALKNLPAGKSVRVLQVGSGKSFEIKGPAEQKAATGSSIGGSRGEEQQAK